DLHLHGRYSRATSHKMRVEEIARFARIKGLNLVGTGDFTHPKWLEELRNNLYEHDNGILKDKSGFNFILSTEIASIYSQNNQIKRIHNIILAPDFDTAEQISEELKRKGVNLEVDGRPMCGISCPELVEMLKSINEKIEIIPAHIWTPWFSLFGSKSGFDRIEDCFQDQTKHIHALETGLSSDPKMNWRLSQLDRFALVSFSDSHSFWPWRLGREATIFELKEMSYDNITKALRTKNGLVGTIEVDPSYGKYHYDGHRECKIFLEPKKAKRIGNICPVCKKPLTIGVLHRVEDLADRDEGFAPKDAKPFYSVLPLSEIISFILNKNVISSIVAETYSKLINVFDSEFKVLLEAPVEEIKNITNEKIGEIIKKMREGKLKIRPGYDGVYGEIIEKENENKEKIPQKTLGDF
ncbi:MAG: endonuclease Q family protein, partial [Candidatus Aenigmatarchaeota archaeon]